MTPLLAVAAAVVVGWFALGSAWNVRKGREALRWLQDGLPLVGPRTTVRWLGTTAIELVVRDALPPFQQVTLLVFLEPRDVPWMWALARSRGRRDTLILRARLRTPPHVDLEAIDRSSWSGRDALPRLAREAWSVREPDGGRGLATFYQAPPALPRADALLELAGRDGLAVRRLSVRRGDPHLQLQVARPEAAAPSRRFFEGVRALGERAGA